MFAVRRAAVIRSGKSGRRSTRADGRRHRRVGGVDQDAVAWEEETSFRNSDFKVRPEFNSCSLEFPLGVSASALHEGGELGLGSLGRSLAHNFPSGCRELPFPAHRELLWSWPEWEASLISPGIRLQGETLGSDSLVCKIEFVVSTAVTINHLGRNVQLMEQSLLACAC